MVVVYYCNVAMQQTQSELHSLLSDAFDGWGSDDYFAWKYTQYPDYDPSADNFTIRNDAGRVVAARRVFRHTLLTPNGESVSTHIHGGTAVAEAYRGRGYYTDLLDASTTMSEREADWLCTFNRAGKITTKHHKKNGWNWLPLPVYALVISPSRIYSHYISNKEFISQLSSRLSAFDRKFTANQVISKSVASIAGWLYGNSKNTQSSGDTPTQNKPQASSSDSLGTERTEPLLEYSVQRLTGPISESAARAVHERLQTQLTDRYHFDRSIERVKHCLSYPKSNLFVAREEPTGKLLDFVIVGTIEKDGLTESRVLEQSWSHPSVTRQLFEAVARESRNIGADVIVAASTVQPGPHWVRLGTEYMMWPPTTDGPQLPTEPDAWRVTMYDML